MVTVPAFVWRGGFGYRAVILGAGAGAAFGALAWLDSGLWQAGACVVVILGIAVGIAMARRMNRYWPGSGDLSGPDRVAVGRAARRGERVAAPALAPAVADYGRGLRAAAEGAKGLRWLVPVVLVVAVATAVWDAVFGSVRDGIASAVYLTLLGLELFWWPTRQDRLLADADRAAEPAL